LDNANATAMEPVLAFITAYIKLRLIVGLFTAAIKLLRFTRLLAIGANVFREFLGRLLGDINAFAMEPIATQIAANIEPTKSLSKYSS